WRIDRALSAMRSPETQPPADLQSLVAATSSLAVLRVGDFGVRTEASLRVAAPVDAAAGLGDVELAPRVDEHLLTPEQTAVFLGNSNPADVVGHEQPSCDCAGGAYMPLVISYPFSVVSQGVLLTTDN